MSGKDSVSNLLNRLPQSDKYINSVNFGDFSNLLESSSSITIDKDTFSNSIRHIQGLLKSKYVNSSLRIYQFRDIYMTLDHTNNKTYMSERHIDTLYNDDLCISVKEVKTVPKENFPIVDKYASVSDQKIKTLSCGKDIKVNFIEQLGLNIKDESSLSIRLDFVNRDREVRDKCERIIKKLSLC